MRQYFEMKATHKDAILLFRVGDFYETFGEDAIVASNVLGIVLTSRNNGGSNIELAGFPHHSLDLYLPRLVKAGYRVAICEQLEKPSREKKIVKRGVTDVVTPGLGTSDTLLDHKENNFIASLFFGEGAAACAFLDLSTGEFCLFEGAPHQVQKLLSTYNPKELLYSKSQEEAQRRMTREAYYTYGLDDWVFQYDYARDQLTDLFKVSGLKGYGIDSCRLGVVTAGVIIHYLASTENRRLDHITQVRRIQLESYVWLDQFTIRNLELLHSNHPSGIPLVEVLDRTITAMGGRLLRKWVVLPLTDPEEIAIRHDAVECLYSQESKSIELEEALKGISDLERIIARVALAKVSPRELLQLADSLRAIPVIQELFSEEDMSPLHRLSGGLEPLIELVTYINESIDEEAPVNLLKGGVIANGYDEDLDQLRSLIRDSKEHLQKVLDAAIEETGISNLKIGFNNVFGYYFEVTNRYKDHELIPASWVRKQTLTNSERYISEDLKKLESAILGAEEKILALEVKLFERIVDHVGKYIPVVQKNATILSTLDCLNGFAKLAIKQDYSRPHMIQEGAIHIEEGRHPVIEAHLPLGESYIPNDVTVDSDQDQILLITGPNMSGKSAILRQTALICLMAQMGSFVPAKYARIGIVDRVFTRVGASDNISTGESTFMVEMIETASILNNLSPRSLILLDEIGRGTSTYDGISIAWSIVEHLHEHDYRPKTLFATHYHELSQLEEKYDRIANFNVATKEHGDHIIFLRKLLPGSTNQSFGIQVAQMAGVPGSIIRRSRTILRSLQQKSVERDKTREKLSGIGLNNGERQLSFFTRDPVSKAIEEELEHLDINSMTPIECMMKLQELALLVREKAH